MLGGGEFGSGDRIEVRVEALRPAQGSHPVRPRRQPCGIEDRAGLLLDLTHSGGEQNAPTLGILGDGRFRPGGGVHLRIGDGDGRCGRVIDGVDAAAGEDDDAGGEVHRRHPVLDEDLESVVPVAEHEHADGGPDRDRLGVGDIGTAARAVGGIRTVGALGVDVSNHVQHLRSQQLMSSSSMPGRRRAAVGGVGRVRSGPSGRRAEGWAECAGDGQDTMGDNLTSSIGGR